ncbi:NAD-P-binding protein [Dentipellis sp. KUC8613]|nr:NAD-P-binding protein [Dentipellis sp. KUC8613]
MGFLFSKQAYDPKRDIPDLTGKVVIVTGSNAGIGIRTVEQLALHGAKVYLACRSEEKATAAIAELEKTNPSLKGRNLLVYLPLDLSSVRSAKKAGEDFLAREDRLDILINNAARGMEPYELSKDGIELTIAINHFGHFVFTETLLPLMKETAKRRDTDVRIVVVSSRGHLGPGTTKFGSLEELNDPQGPPAKINSMGTKMGRYGTSKLMNVLFASELQRRLDVEKVPITVMSLHPGAVATEAAFAADLPWFLKAYIATFAAKPLEGAYTSLFAATSARVAAEREKYKGKYLVPYGEIGGPATPAAKDPVLAKTLWETTEKITAGLLKTTD